MERAEIIREKGTNRTRFFRGQVDKYTWVDVGSSYLPAEVLAAFLLTQLRSMDQDHRATSGAICEAYDSGAAAGPPSAAGASAVLSRRIAARTITCST